MRQKSTGGFTPLDKSRPEACPVAPRDGVGAAGAAPWLRQPAEQGGRYLTGFTLLEVIVVITIMTIITLVILSALPAARQDQVLKSDIVALRSTLAEAQQRALNEIRPPDCLDLVGGDEETGRRCSDVGVAVLDQQVILFSDLNADTTYSPGTDYLIQERATASRPDETTPITAVFLASPPSVTTVVNGEVLGPNDTVLVTLSVDTATRDLTIGPYGILEDATQE